MLNLNPRVVMLFALLLGILACGSGPKDQAFLVTPQTSTVAVGEKLTLAAQPNTDMQGEPRWEMQELMGGNFLNSKGFQVTFIAPPTAGTYHAVLHYHRPDGSLKKFIHEIQVLPQVTLEPAQARVAPGGNLQFHARVKGLSQCRVNWYVEEEGGGTLTPQGLYTAPSASGSYHILANVEGFPSAMGSTLVRVE